MKLNNDDEILSKRKADYIESRNIYYNDKMTYNTEYNKNKLELRKKCILKKINNKLNPCENMILDKYNISKSNALYIENLKDNINALKEYLNSQYENHKAYGLQKLSNYVLYHDLNDDDIITITNNGIIDILISFLSGHFNSFLSHFLLSSLQTLANLLVPSNYTSNSINIDIDSLLLHLGKTIKEKENRTEEVFSYIFTLLENIIWNNEEDAIVIFGSPTFWDIVDTICKLQKDEDDNYIIQFDCDFIKEELIFLNSILNSINDSLDVDDLDENETKILYIILSYYINIVLMRNSIEENKEDILLLCYEGLCAFTAFNNEKIDKIIEQAGIHMMLIKSRFSLYSSIDEKLLYFRTKIIANLLAQNDNRVKTYILSLNVIGFFNNVIKQNIGKNNNKINELNKENNNNNIEIDEKENINNNISNKSNKSKTIDNILRNCILGLRNIAASGFKILLLENSILFEKEILENLLENSSGIRDNILKCLYYLIKGSTNNEENRKKVINFFYENNTLNSILNHIKKSINFEENTLAETLKIMHFYLCSFKGKEKQDKIFTFSFNLLKNFLNEYPYFNKAKKKGTINIIQIVENNINDSYMENDEI